MGGIVYLYLAGINIVSFCLMGADKKRAIHHAWRISEKTLFATAILGGSLGAVCGMRVFHHKTKHWYFVWGMPMILLAHFLLAGLYFYYCMSIF